jgi:GNAT superfamily N-acetyltransferase
MSGYTVRPAAPADLGQINAIWYSDEVEGADDAPPQSAPLALFPYLMTQGDLRVALDSDGAISGFGGAITWPTPRGPLTYLSDLFVSAGAQSRGAGQALLSELLPTGGARCVIASRDFRANALYIRNGMTPRWPVYWVISDAPDQLNLESLPGADVSLAPTDVADSELAQWDAEICGYARHNDLRWLVETRDAQAYWVMRSGERLGYAFLQRVAVESLWRPHAWTLGPIGARSANDASACVGSVIRYAAGRAPSLRLSVPGPHPALPSLLAAGMRLSDIETFLTSADGAPFDPARYIHHGAIL